MSSWADTTQARVLWANAPDDDALLDLLLASAQEVCETYAPVLPEPVPPDPPVVPYRYTQAVVYQARDTWAVQGPLTDQDGLLVVPRPMSPTVKALLRPKPGVPVVG